MSEEGTYTVTYSTGCDTYTDEMTITTDPYLLVDPDLGPDTLVCEILGSLILDAGPDLPDYNWNTGETTPTITVTEEGAYWVLVPPCAAPMGDTIIVSPCLFLNVPNAFSPNDDGLNDVFRCCVQTVKISCRSVFITAGAI